MEQVWTWKDSLKLYWWNWLVGLDQFVNTWFGGSPDETMSSRVGRYRDQHADPGDILAGFGLMLARLTCWILDKIQPQHVEKALEPADRHDRDLLK